MLGRIRERTPGCEAFGGVPRGTSTRGGRRAFHVEPAGRCAWEPERAFARDSDPPRPPGIDRRHRPQPHQMGRGGLPSPARPRGPSGPARRPATGRIGFRRLAHQDLAAGTEEADGVLAVTAAARTNARSRRRTSLADRGPGPRPGPRRRRPRPPPASPSGHTLAEEVAPPLGRIEQHADNIGAVGQDHQPRKPAAGSEVEEPDVGRSARTKARAWSSWGRGDPARGVRWPARRPDGFDPPGRRGGGAADPRPRSNRQAGRITTRRRGSSPSEIVLTPSIVPTVSWTTLRSAGGSSARGPPRCPTRARGPKIPAELLQRGTAASPGSRRRRRQFGRRARRYAAGRLSARDPRWPGGSPLRADQHPEVVALDVHEDGVLFDAYRHLRRDRRGVRSPRTNSSAASACSPNGISSVST